MEGSVDRQRLLALDVLAIIPFHRPMARAFDESPLVPQDRDVLIALHHLRAIADDVDPLIAAGNALAIPLGALVEELVAFSVLEADLVEPFPLRRALAPPHGLCLVLRQWIRRGVVSIRDATNDDRLIRIAAEVAHEDLLPDAGDRPKAVGGAGPSLDGAELFSSY